MSAETVADLRSLSTLPPGLVLVIATVWCNHVFFVKNDDELEPRFDLVVRLEQA
jgi:hypothetical protein